MSCSEEHFHSHHHDESNHVAPSETSSSNSLFKYIDLPHLSILNESTDTQSSSKLFRPYNERFVDVQHRFVESDADEQLLINIQFTGTVKLISIIIWAPDDEYSPKEILLFKNKSNLDFDNINDLKPIFTINHPENVGTHFDPESFNLINNNIHDDDVGITEHFLPRHLFSGVTNLKLFIKSNYGEDTTRLLYMDFRGTCSPLVKNPVITLYEAAANPADHKTFVPGEKWVNENLGGE